VRILHVITTLDVGGAEMHLLSQVRGQTERGHQVRVCYLKGAGSLEPDFLRAGAREVCATGSGPAAVGRLWSRMRAADVVHTHLLKADALGAVVAALAGRRSGLVASKHNDEQVLRRPLVSRVHGLVGSLPRRTIVLSDHVGGFVERYGRVPRERQTRIYYGIDPAPFERAAADAAADPAARAALRAELGCGPDDLVLVCVARFAPQKAHDVLLRAFARARETVGELRLWLVGDDPFGDGRRKAEAVARELGLEGCTFAGIRRDVPQVLAAADVFCMTSLWEGLGLVFLEAMAAGLPVVASRVSAVPEVVVAGETGLLAPAGDAEAFAAAFVELARDPDRRRAMGLAGRRRVHERFGLDRMVEATLEVYEALGPFQARPPGRR